MTVRNNSNIIISFQQTLEDVEHIHRDIAGFDMSYEEFKSLCREAWNEKFNYLLINSLEVKTGVGTGFVRNLIQITRTLIHKLIL